MQYNKESVEVRADGETSVSAVLHRPLRGEPWSFGYAGVCPLALADTEGRCVQRQLELLTQEQNLEKDFDEIFAQLYGEEHENNPYLIEAEDGTIAYGWRDAGITCAMVHAFAVCYNVPVHIVHGEQTKILSYRPETASGGGQPLSARLR